MQVSATHRALYLIAAICAAGGVDAENGRDTELSYSESRGKSIVFDSTRGNCLACHQIEDSESPGDLGPPLIAIKARFPDKNMLREQLWDPMEYNPNSRMPPFGRHRILTEEEISMVVEYIYSL